MATYIMMSTLADEGRKTLKERPERLKEVNKEVESMGAKVVSQFAVLGGYDDGGGVLDQAMEGPPDASQGVGILMAAGGDGAVGVVGGPGSHGCP